MPWPISTRPWPGAGPMSEGYSVIYADPPWDYRGQTQHSGKGSTGTGGAASHYQTITLQRLKTLRVADHCAPDALLFLWATGPHLDQAIDLLKSWGFRWATVAFVWAKDRVNPGFYTMSQCEFVLCGKRGRIPQPRGARNVRQLVEAPRGRHSRKPAEVRRRIVEMFPDHRRLELFARERAEGWDAWGHEVVSDVEMYWGTG